VTSEAAALRFRRDARLGLSWADRSRSTAGRPRARVAGPARDDCPFVVRRQLRSCTARLGRSLFFRTRTGTARAVPKSPPRRAPDAAG